MRIAKSPVAFVQSAVGASLLLLLPILLTSSGNALAATTTATIGVTILGRADVEVAAGAVSVTGLRSIELGGASPTPATVRLEGARNATFSIAVPYEVRAADGGRGIVVRPVASSVGSSGRLSPDGGLTLEIGAGIAPGTAPVTGRYAGTFPVTIAYN